LIFEAITPLNHAIVQACRTIMGEYDGSVIKLPSYQIYWS